MQQNMSQVNFGKNYPSKQLQNHKNAEKQVKFLKSLNDSNTIVFYFKIQSEPEKNYDFRTYTRPKMNFKEISLRGRKKNV